MASDDAEILKAAAEGYPVREIAAAHDMTEAAVTAVLERETEAWFEGAHLRRELLLEGRG